MVVVPLGPHAGTVTGASHCPRCGSYCHTVREDDGRLWLHATWLGLAEQAGVRHVCLRPGGSYRDRHGYAHVGVAGGVLLLHPNREVNLAIIGTARAGRQYPSATVLTEKAA